MELIGKISKGTKMDQIYISKQRVPGFEVGESVLIKLIKENDDKERISKYNYNIRNIEPFKSIIIGEIFNYLSGFGNIIIGGSFLEKGNYFEDIDVILISDKDINLDKIKDLLKNKIGISIHLIKMSYTELLMGYNNDPLFQILLSKFISKERIILRKNNKFNYKLLDLYLLESKLLIDNFNILSGREKYKLVRNLFGVKLFIDGKNLSKEEVDNEIGKFFGKGIIFNIKENLIEKEPFLDKYKKIYFMLFEKIMEGIKKEEKDEQK